MKTLLMDVGNSRIKWGVLSNGEIKRTGHISQARIREKTDGPHFAGAHS
jgi:pantothenate kinase type III